MNTESKLEHLLPLLEEIQEARKKAEHDELILNEYSDVYHDHIKKCNKSRSQVRYLARVLDMCLAQNMDPTQAKLTITPEVESDEQIDLIRSYTRNAKPSISNKAKVEKQQRKMSTWAALKKLFK